MKILVTGHKGFIGTSLYNQFVNSLFILEELENDLIGFDIKDCEGDITKEFREFLFTEKPDVIFHVGANSDTLLFDVNIMLTQNLEMCKIIADYCRLYTNTKLIYSSSASCYGNSDIPNTLYGWSKYAGENILRPYAISLRYFNVYGFDESRKGKMASVAFQSYIKHKKNLEIGLFPLKPARDFVYVKDVVSANIFSWKNFDTLKGLVYDVGTGEARTFEDVLDIMDIPYKIIDESNIPKNYQFYTCATNILPNWKAEYNLEAGLEDYMKYLKFFKWSEI